ncbi:MAG: NAD(P)H-binding protein [Paracoccus sp. (in: a-proteobacteria)]|uniref:NAD(P)-dependent oxidoreductase n=1 Tax=Paracoccus sp. TaxID=267 RepID=UPI0026DEAB21|nr:NAD(P)H-binding protein [Paracoccus sp. (in: a-proteobacteria)]MDO5633055.1 NAD(P)H-binding protein [Paracoccus sp. (in: a-proteobacteria)]
MKICVLGATGNVGRRVVAQALADGHQVTAVLRDSSVLPVTLTGKVRAAVADYASEASIAAAVAGHDAVINAAGYVTQPDFVRLVGRVIRACDAALGTGGRFWMMAGAALLDVPGTDRMTLDYPMIPAHFQAHRQNFRLLQQTGLDWSALCPGPMIEAPDARPTPGLLLSENIWPLSRWGLGPILPDAATTINFARLVPRMTIYYEDAAQVIMGNLDRNGRFFRSRIGIALPDGERRHKPSVTK